VTPTPEQPRLLVARVVTDRRLATLRAALGFLQIRPHAPELQLLHRWLDSWMGVGLIVVGVERQGLRFSLTGTSPRASGGRSFSAQKPDCGRRWGTASRRAPWRATQIAAWAAVKRGDKAMKQLARRASLVAVLLLLAWVGTALAECAWVLWQLDQTPIEGRADRVRYDWHPAGATGTEARCDAWLQQWTADDKTKNRIFRCLPDTVDPRGPKTR
jgi:hypothetical protein